MIKRSGFLLVPIIFFIISLATLYDYGMNWDSPVHFARGQAYLRYILTGKRDYNDNPPFCVDETGLNSRVDYQTGEVCDRHRKVRVSEYESKLLDFNSWVGQATYGHPAFSNLMLALSNNIFFKYLGLLDDIPAYHLYIVIAAFLLALSVSIWVKKTYGIFASIVSVFSLYTFPLLFAEQHFNVKDPPMMSFFVIALFLFWLAFTKREAKYLLLSALAGGASFGTKFNFLFAPFLLLPWFIVYTVQNFREKLLAFKKITLKRVLQVLFSLYPRRFLLALVVYPVIVFGVFYFTWPALWPDPINNVFNVISFYKDVGGASCSYSFPSLDWITQCTQLTALKYVLYTTPPVTLVLFLIGTFFGILHFKDKGGVVLIWLSLFCFTVLRVTFSLTSIYGGIRQIMEFVPAMAMLAGFGAAKLAKTKYLQVVILLLFVPIILTLSQTHPNQNVYFNSLIGGLSGAAKHDFPGYGNTYGNVYLQGISWINQNAEKNASFALVSGNAQNISRSSIREDIDFSNGSKSGYNFEGEYQMSLVVGQDIFDDTFRYMYLDIFLNEVYSVRVDGIPILKIWKNDKKYLKDGVDLEGQSVSVKKSYSKNNEVILELEKLSRLKALAFVSPNTDCKDSMIGTKIEVSTDGGKYVQKAETINNFTSREIAGYNADFVYLFPGDEAKFIRVSFPENYSCKLSTVGLEIFSLR